MKRRILPLILALAMTTTTFGAETSITAFGNRITLENDVKIINGRSYLPLREVGKKVLGAVVGWKAETKTAILSKGIVDVSVPVGSNQIYVNNIARTADAPAFIENGTTYVPIRAVAEGFNLQVDYANKMITISEKPLPQLSALKDDETIAVMHTNKGDIKLRFFPEYAPKAVENFITLAEQGYYDGITFHRVINDFMIQGGDPTATGMGGESIWGEPFELEVTPYLRNFRGALCMANSGTAVSNGSQFYIVQGNNSKNYLNMIDGVNDGYLDYFPLTLGDIYDDKAREGYKTLGGYPSLDYGYTVFGQVVEGMDVVDTIAKAETDSADKPVEDVVITGIDIN